MRADTLLTRTASDTVENRLKGPARWMLGQLGDLRAMPALSRAARAERARELLDPAPVQRDHHRYLAEAIDWLTRAQDATSDDGIARGFSLIWNPYFRESGWQPSYPETTGYIIPTLYTAARWRAQSELASRATRAARWEIEIQLASGAVQGGVIGQTPAPAIFNTGQVMLGWIAALEETGDEIFEHALRRAADFLLSAERGGEWIHGNSTFARSDTTAYNARTGWALAEAGQLLHDPRYTSSAARVLRRVAHIQHDNGWFPECCLNDPNRPLLHTIAYSMRGLLEGGRVLGDERLIRAAALTGRSVMQVVRPDGWIAGRLDSKWRAVAPYSCLTGDAQIANNWLRLAAITGDRSWLEKVEPVLSFLKQRQNSTSPIGGVRGAIAGSWPLYGEYGRYEMLSWATKFFADALMRDASARTGLSLPAISRLA